MPNELTDEQVMAPPPQREMTDEEVMRPQKDLFTQGVQGAVDATPKGYWGRIVDAFKGGAAEGYGDTPFGFSETNKTWLRDSTNDTYKAFVDNALIPATAYADSLWRTPNSIIHAFGDALIEAGVPRDFVSMLAGEAFYGSPKPTGMFSTPKLAKPGVEEPPPGPPKPSPIEQAADLGVIGPEKPRLSEGTPEEAATKATQPALATSTDEKITGEPPKQNPWQERFEHFVSQLKTSDDVKDLIRNAAKENDDFLPARQGDIPLKHVEDLAEAAGVTTDTVDRAGVGRLMRNDNEVRVALRLMMQATEDVKEAARKVKENDTPETQLAVQEAMRRRDLAVEQVVGLRAEWGRTGRAIQEVMDIAKSLDGLDNTQAARVLSDANKKRPGPFYWTWVNGLISGWLTHTKYGSANALYAASENGVTPLLAAVIGKAKQAFGAEVERVYFGEPMAATWGLISAVPGAAISSVKSMVSGQRAVLKSEIELHKAAIERGEKVSPLIDKAVNQVTGQMKPEIFQGSDVWGKLKGGDWAGAAKDALGRTIGAPGDAAMGIHTFFKILGERAGLEAEAYRAAIKEGHNPADGEFWNRRAWHSENPTDEMRERAVAGAYKGTFMSELGPRGKAWQRFTKETPGLRWIFPFSHIPVNLIKATYEHTPLAILDSEMRGDILGKNGGVRQDKAIARMVVGSAIMGYFAHQALMGRATGDYPLDPKERDSWKLQGKQPNSIQIGNYWVSFGKFGPAGDLANLGANIAYVIPHLTSGDDDAMALGTLHAANAAARLIVDEVGFQSLANILDAVHDEKKGAAFVASTAASFVPFSSFFRQMASFNDPHMREAKSIFDGIKSALPGARETLLPKRDWLGNPVPNAQYHSLLRQREIINDPVSTEMDRLQIHPGPPSDRVGGVKMTPEMYDRYQAVAGALTKQTLDAIVNNPGWKEKPDIFREMAIRTVIKETRAMAAGAMQAANPSLLAQALKQRTDHITGVTHTDRPKRAPEL